MSGALWAVVAGLGFGLFQTVNRRAVWGMDVYLATFVQLATSAVILAVAAAATAGVASLWSAPPQALMNFALAGFVHFFVGWTLLNASQKLIGAARTSPLIGTTPLFGTLFAALVLRELPHPQALAGIAVVVAGVTIISSERMPAGDRATIGVGLRGSMFGLGAAMLWAVSPIFIRRGLAVLPSPLLGVTVGMVTSSAAYGVGLLVRSATGSRPQTSKEALTVKLLAGVLVGFSVWARWIALSLAPVGVVLAVALLSVPVVMLLSPIVVGRHLERVTARVWLGGICTVAGSLALVLLG